MTGVPKSLSRQLILACSALVLSASLAGWFILERSAKNAANVVIDARLIEVLDELRGVWATLEITNSVPTVAGDLELLWQIESEAIGIYRSELLSQNDLVLPHISDAAEPEFRTEASALGPLRMVSRQLLEMVPAPPESDARSYRRVTYWAALTADRQAILSERVQGPLKRAGSQVLAGFAMLLVLSLLVIATIVRRPLTRLRLEAQAFAQGDRQRLSPDYPSELQLVVDHLNSAADRLERSAEQSRRYINKIAHDLKTPIAVVENALDDPSQHKTARQRLTAMRDTIARYGTLATAIGPGQPQPLRALFEPLRGAVDAFGLLYRATPWTIDLVMDQALMARLSLEDVDTITSNLLSNAHKHAKSRAILSVVQDDDGLKLRCEDDGLGLSPDEFAQALGWGVKLDERPAGSGLGLAILSDVAALYDGEVRRIESSLGGLGVEVELKVQLR